jgi:hypothetical protein
LRKLSIFCAVWKLCLMTSSIFVFCPFDDIAFLPQFVFLAETFERKCCQPESHGRVAKERS